MKLQNLYVLVQDTDRAIDFYTRILPFKLHRRQDRYTILNLGDFWLGLLNEKFETEVKRGNNCVPVFQVDNVRAEYNRLKELGVNLLSEITELPDVFLFQFTDSEGNVLEMYQER
jgi:predicted enzyme related to lactoylglutathione lyase